MKKLLIASLVVVSLATGPVHAGIPVSIMTNIQGALEHLDRIRHYIEVINKMKDALEEAKKTTNALTGMRNLGAIFEDPQLRQYMAAEYGRLYDGMKREGYAGLLENGRLTYALNQFADNCATLAVRNQKMYCEAVASKPSQDYATANDTFERTMIHTMNITKLQQEINRTQDMKSIAELQARIEIEQTHIANLSNQLVAAKDMSEAQDRINAQVAVERNGTWYRSTGRLQLEPVGGN